VTFPLVCPGCGALPLSGAHICEWGVTTVPEITVEFSLTFDDAETYERTLGTHEGPSPDPERDAGE
jgi:hypothetical protein